MHPHTRDTPAPPRNPADSPPLLPRAPRDPWSTKKRDVPYVPTDDQVVRGMLKLARLSPADTLYDLGCGDGRIVIAAARHGTTAIGVDIDPQRLAESAENARRASHGISSRFPDGTTRWHIRPHHSPLPNTPHPTVHFLEQSLFDLDFSAATVITLYLLPKINQRLLPKFLALRPGTRLISNSFPMGYDLPLWQPDQTLTLHHRQLLKWIVPAPLAGTWRGTMQLPNLSRTHLALHLAQQFQLITGTALLSDPTLHRWRELPLGRPTLSGPTFTAHLPTGPTSSPLDLHLTYSPNTLRGTWHSPTSSGPLYLLRR